MIPLLDLKPEIALLRKELDAAYARVMEHGRFVMGPEVKELEQQVAGLLGARYAVSVNSGTDALLLALRAAGVGAGDEVITSTFTFFATAESIEMSGARPVFVDVDPVDFNLDPAAVERAITPRTKAIVPVHLFGKAAPMARIMEFADRHGLLVVEDCAQSFGASYEGTCACCRAGGTGNDAHRDMGVDTFADTDAHAEKDTFVDTDADAETVVDKNADAGADSGYAAGCDAQWRGKLIGRQTGTIGQAGAFSFFPSKNLGGFGDGGMITTDDAAIAEKAAMLRVHGAKKKYHNEVLGYNSRLDTLQAALLQVKLRHIGDFNARRREVARRYIEALEGLDGVAVPVLPDDGHVYHQFTMRLPGHDRDKVAEELREQGVQTMVYYPVPVHKLPIYRCLELTLPVAEEVAGQVLSLPVGPFLSAGDQQQVIDVLRRVLGA